MARVSLHLGHWVHNLHRLQRHAYDDVRGGKYSSPCSPSLNNTGGSFSFAQQSKWEIIYVSLAILAALRCGKSPYP